MEFSSTDSTAPPAVRRSRGLWGVLRVTLWTLATLLLLVLIAALCGLLWVRHAMSAALPAVDGSIKLPSLSAPVVVRRDSHGVPHIAAATQDDLLLAQGYVTAQDRLWQMDMLRRNSAGELAEVLGPSLLEHDKEQRVLQFRNVAQRIYGSLPEADRHRYEQYAAGVNLCLTQNLDHLPAEFRLMHYRPKPWTGLDSILIGLSMVQNLDTHWDNKLSRERISTRLHDPKLAAELYPIGSWRDQPPTAAVADMTEPHPAPLLEDDPENDQTQTHLEDRQPTPAHEFSASKQEPLALSSSDFATSTLRAFLGRSDCKDCIPGSNSWVIAGKHTASGKPLLSNDMHLALTVPNIWYTAELNAPGLHVAGVTLPGMPLVLVGHNEHVAWGLTALYADVQDLYVEKLDGKGNYAGPNGQWLPLTHTPETIHVRFKSDVHLDVQLTAHGPLLNPILKAESRPLALHWSLYDPALAGIPLYEMNTAADWQHFSNALAAWCFPTQNLVYADDQGHIAYHAIGKVPLRPAGLVGVPIQDSAHEWQGYIPFEELPFSVDPPSGLLATANARVTPNDTRFPLTLEWADPYRAERIYMDLRGRNKLTRQDMLQVQTDIYSELDQELAHRIAYALDQNFAQNLPQASTQTPAHTAAADAQLKQAADLMRSWDGRMSIDSPAASILYRTRQAFWPLILQPRLGNDSDSYEWAESNFAEEEIIMHGGVPNSDAALGHKSTWLPAGYKDWDALLTEAVRRGLARGKAPANLALWNYGSWHVIDLEHPLFERMPILKGWSGTGEQPLSGDTVTVKQVGRAFGPSQRFTMDWSDPDGSVENIVLGESGNPLSPWFQDQWPAWYNGTTLSLPFSAKAVDSAASHTLRLVP